MEQKRERQERVKAQMGMGAGGLRFREQLTGGVRRLSTGCKLVVVQDVFI